MIWFFYKDQTHTIIFPMTFYDKVGFCRGGIARLNAFDFCCLKRLLGIPGLAKKTNRS